MQGGCRVARFMCGRQQGVHLCNHCTNSSPKSQTHGQGRLEGEGLPTEQEDGSSSRGSAKVGRRFSFSQDLRGQWRESWGRTLSRGGAGRTGSSQDSSVSKLFNESSGEGKRRVIGAQIRGRSEGPLH